MMELFTPRNIISGRVKAARGQELQTAAAAAAAVLGTESIALVHSRSQDDVWYLATPTAELASHPASASPLSVALPGVKGHEGDGAYVSDLAGGLQAVVVKQGESLHSFVGTLAMAKRFATLEGATASHVCLGEGLPWQLPAQATQRRDALLKRALTASGLVVALLASGTWLWAARDVSHQTELRDALRQDHLKAWTTAVGMLEPPAYPKALADLQKAITQAIKEKGVLVKFEHQDGRSNWTLNVNNRVVTGASN
jgi:hypothetical protein